MSVLGELIVRLGVSTASFTEGMNAASKTAKSAGRDIEGAFTSLGSVAESALAPLGELGETVASTLDKIGSSAGGVIQAFGKLGGAMGTVSTIGGGITAAMGAVATGSVALTVHVADAAAKLYELSQSTGISTETLSGLGYAAKQNGVPMESLTRSLEFLNQAAIKAAISPEGTKTAFSRLGIQVRDTSGQIKDAGTLFSEVADKIASLPPGPEQGYFTRMLFGKGGQELMPLLNEGASGIAMLTEKAQMLGEVVDSQTAKAAEDFKRSLDDISAASDGLSTNLMKALLPALQTVTNQFNAGLADDSELKAFLSGVAVITKAVLTLGETVVGVFQYVGATIAAQLTVLDQYAEGVAKMMNRAVHLDWSGFLAEAKDAGVKMASVLQDTADHGAKIWSNYFDTVSGIWGKAKFVGPMPLPEDTDKFSKAGSHAKPSSDVDLSPAKDRRDIIAETIGKLQAQTAEEAALANAISGTMANTILATAAAEAEKTIIETNTRAEEQHRELTETEKQQIRELTALKNGYNAAYKDNAGLEDFIQKTDLTSKSLGDLGKAYAAQNSLGIEQAKEAEKLAPYKKQIDDISVLVASVRALGATNDQLAPLLSSLGQMQQKFAVAQVSVHALFTEEEIQALNKTTHDLDEQTSAMDGVITAALGGAAAMRQFNIEQQVKKFESDNPLLSSDQIDKYRQSLTGLDDAKRADAVASSVAASQSFLATKQQIDDLEILRQKEVESGQDTTATDLLIYQNKIKYVQEYMQYATQAQSLELLGNEKLFDSQNSLIQQWDQAALKVGDFGQKFEGVMGELVVQGREAGEAIAKAFLTATNSIETQFAKLLTGQKANFKQVFQNLGESVVKAGIQNMVGHLAGALGGGKAAKADGSSTNPFYVKLASGLGSALGGGAHSSNDSSGGGGFIDTIKKTVKKIFGLGGGSSTSDAVGANLPDGTQDNPFYVLNANTSSISGAPDFSDLLSSLGGGTGESSGVTGGGSGLASLLGGGSGGLFSSLFDSLGAIPFGGFLAGGGDMSPGHMYVAGEEGPEPIIPKSDMTAVPASRFGGKTTNTTVNMNIIGGNNIDLFKRSQSQIMQGFHRQVAIANSRG